MIMDLIGQKAVN